MSASSWTADLLWAARGALRDGLVPMVPAAGRYPAAMVANAMAIAARELEHGVAGRDELMALHARLDDGMEPSTSLAERERRLVARIRAGDFDHAQAGRLRAVLLARTRVRLRISNPDYLEAAGLD